MTESAPNMCTHQCTECKREWRFSAQHPVYACACGSTDSFVPITVAEQKSEPLDALLSERERVLLKEFAAETLKVVGSSSLCAICANEGEPGGCQACRRLARNDESYAKLRCQLTEAKSRILQLKDEIKIHVEQNQRETTAADRVRDDLKLKLARAESERDAADKDRTVACDAGATMRARIDVLEGERYESAHEAPGILGELSSLLGCTKLNIIEAVRIQKAALADMNRAFSQMQKERDEYLAHLKTVESAVGAVQFERDNAWRTIEAMSKDRCPASDVNGLLLQQLKTAEAQRNDADTSLKLICNVLRDAGVTDWIPTADRVERLATGLRKACVALSDIAMHRSNVTTYSIARRGLADITAVRTEP